MTAPVDSRTRLAVGAGVAVALQVTWLLVMASQELALLLARGLQRIGASAELVERGLDAALALPLVLVGAGFAVWARRFVPGTARGAGRALRALPLAGAAALLIFYADNRDYLLYRASEVREGTLYRSGQTSAATLERLLQRDGIRTLLYLRGPGDELERERELAARRGVRFEHLPMGDRHTAVTRFLEIMDDPANHPVLVHCRYGIARTGLLAGIYRIEYEGWEPIRALREARRFSGYGGLAAGSSTRAFLVSYSPRPLGPEAAPPTRP